MSFPGGRGSRRAEASENALRLRGSVALPAVGKLVFLCPTTVIHVNLCMIET